MIAKKQALFFGMANCLSLCQFSLAKTPDEQYEYLRGRLDDHSPFGYEEENDLLTALLREMLQDRGNE
jgi:hypothetical protein